MTSRNSSLEFIFNLNGKTWEFGFKYQSRPIKFDETKLQNCSYGSAQNKTSIYFDLLLFSWENFRTASLVFDLEFILTNSGSSDIFIQNRPARYLLLFWRITIPEWKHTYYPKRSLHTNSRVVKRRNGRFHVHLLPRHRAYAHISDVFGVKNFHKPKQKPRTILTAICENDVRLIDILAGAKRKKRRG